VSSVALERVVRRAKGADRNLMRKRGELLLLPAPCGRARTRPSAWVTRVPALSPVCALLARVSLRSPALAHRLRRRRPALSGGFSATVPESDFSRPCIGIYGTTADVGALI
jgi:hypothetical protein